MRSWLVVVAMGLVACGGAQGGEEAELPAVCAAYGDGGEAPAVAAPGVDSPLTYVVGGTVMTAAGDIWAPGWVAFEDGFIVDLGPGEVEVPAGAIVIDATGGYVTPGVIDTHSHLGVYPVPNVAAHSDGNEATSPATPEVQAEHSVWPQDPGFERAIAGGVTAMQILPGSANLVGGRGFVMKNYPDARVASDLTFVGAPQTLKMACGENPKRVYGNRGQMPSTRMGSIASVRQMWIDAQAYQRQWSEYDEAMAEWCENGAPEDEEPDRPSRDLGNETLVGVLEGEILPQIHCYRADEMLTQIEVAEEFGFSIRSFHHATDAYKIRDVLAEHDIAASIWADWWGFKIEAFDSIVESAALLHEAGGRPIIHSDSAIGIQRLNQEAAKAYYAGVRAGIELDDNDVLRWITYNPAWALGVEELTGTLERGKMADVVIWSAHPFSMYARATHVWIDGNLSYERAVSEQPWSDFEAGLWPESFDRSSLPTAAAPFPALGIDALAGYAAPTWTAELAGVDGPLCLTGARVFPVAGEPFDGTVCMADGVITAAGEVVTTPAGARLIDVEGAVITPGLVDVNTQLGLVEISAVEHTRNGDEGGEGGNVRAAFRAIDAFDPSSSLIGVTREGGVTSVVSAPGGGVIPGQAAWFDLGAEPGVAEGTPSAMTFRLGRFHERSRGWTVLRYREILRDAQVYFDLQNRYDANGVRDLSMSYLDIEALEPVLTGEMPVLAHVRHRVDVEASLRLAEEFGFDMTLVNVEDAWSMADRLADADVTVVVETMTNLPGSFETLGACEENAALLARAGVPVAITTNSAHNVRLLRQFAGNAVRAGLDWNTALEAVTRVPATIMGVDDHYGALAPGYVANVVVWSGDPFEASTTVDAMIVHGEPVSTRNRQTALFERYRDHY